MNFGFICNKFNFVSGLIATHTLFVAHSLLLAFVLLLLFVLKFRGHIFFVQRQFSAHCCLHCLLYFFVVYCICYCLCCFPVTASTVVLLQFGGGLSSCGSLTSAETSCSERTLCTRKTNKKSLKAHAAIRKFRNFLKEPLYYYTCLEE